MKQMHAISCIHVRDRKLHPVIGRRVAWRGPSIELQHPIGISKQGGQGQSNIYCCLQEQRIV